MNNGPISVSAPGTSLTSASGTNLTFNTRYPFHKLDSTNEKSFQVISIFFNTEPPDPPSNASGTTYSSTVVYSYKHGYNYNPSTWFLISTDNFSTVLGPEGTQLVTIGNIPGSTNATLNIKVDDTTVYFYIDKQWGYAFGTPDPTPPHVIGFTVSIRAYIFVEDLTGTSVPSHA